MYNPRIRTKNSTAKDLRSSGTGIGRFTKKSVIRLGSLTKTEGVFKNIPSEDIIEVNTVDSIKNSRNKLLMKQCFAEAETPQSDWFIWENENTFINQITNETIDISDLLNILSSGLLMKRVCGFKGKGMYLIKNMEDWEAFKAIAKQKYPNLEY